MAPSSYYQINQNNSTFDQKLDAEEFTPMINKDVDLNEENTSKENDAQLNASATEFQFDPTKLKFNLTAPNFNPNTNLNYNTQPNNDYTQHSIRNFNTNT